MQRAQLILLAYILVCVTRECLGIANYTIVSTSIFDFTGQDQYVIPPGTQAYVYLWGAGGGQGSPNNAPGGAGAYVEGLLSGLIPGHTYTIVVGEGKGPYGGGGSPGRLGTACVPGSHGGGRSAISFHLNDIVTAGGGGGALRDYQGGPATSFSGGNIDPVSFQGCSGGVRSNDYAGTCGGGGNKTSGGKGGQTYSGSDIANNGVQYAGANATCLTCIGLEVPTPTAGGGGGGGYFGGGAGCTAGGGGGGSSFINPDVLSDYNNSQSATSGSPVGANSPYYGAGFGSGLSSGGASQNGRVVLEFLELPSNTPSLQPTFRPTFVPSATPSAVPTFAPSAVPSTATPTAIPSTASPTPSPTAVPTAVPSTARPTAVPSTAAPTVRPTKTPTASPSYSPSYQPTLYFPTSYPTPLNPVLFAEMNESTLWFITGMLMLVGGLNALYISYARAALCTLTNANIIGNCESSNKLVCFASKDILFSGYCSFVGATTMLLLVVNSSGSFQALIVLVRVVIATSGMFMSTGVEALMAVPVELTCTGPDGHGALWLCVLLFSMFDPSFIRFYGYRATAKTERYLGFPTHNIFKYCMLQQLLNAAMGVCIAGLRLSQSMVGVNMRGFASVSLAFWLMAFIYAYSVYADGVDAYASMLKGKRVISDSFVSSHHEEDDENDNDNGNPDHEQQKELELQNRRPSHAPGSFQSVMVNGKRVFRQDVDPITLSSGAGTGRTIGTNSSNNVSTGNSNHSSEHASGAGSHQRIGSSNSGSGSSSGAASASASASAGGGSLYASAPPPHYIPVGAHDFDDLDIDDADGDTGGTSVGRRNRNREDGEREEEYRQRKDRERARVEALLSGGDDRILYDNRTREAGRGGGIAVENAGAAAGSISSHSAPFAGPSNFGRTGTVKGIGLGRPAATGTATATTGSTATGFFGNSRASIVKKTPPAPPIGKRRSRASSPVGSDSSDSDCHSDNNARSSAGGIHCSASNHVDDDVQVRVKRRTRPSPGCSSSSSGGGAVTSTTTKSATTTATVEHAEPFRLDIVL